MSTKKKKLPSWHWKNHLDESPLTGKKRPDMVKRNRSSKMRKMVSQRMKGRKITWGDKISSTMKQRAKEDSWIRPDQYPGARKKISVANKKRWERPGYKEYMLPRMVAAQRRRPTGIETVFQKICNKYRLPYQYVGDGTFWVQNLNPDFVNKKTKLAIEIFGEDFHMSSKLIPNVPYKQTEKGRKSQYKKLGWKCIVIWGKELSNENDVILKIRKHSMGQR